MHSAAWKQHQELHSWLYVQQTYNTWALVHIY
jgi:hypothetical protein